MKWLDTIAAAEYLGFANRKAFYKAVEKHGIPCVRIGTSLRFSQSQLDAYMEMLKRKRILRRVS